MIGKMWRLSFKTSMVIALLLSTCVGLAAELNKMPRENKVTIHEGKPADESSMVTLDELISTALDQNPSIQAAGQAAESKRARIIAERTLPDPTFSFQTMGDPFPFNLQVGDPSSGRAFTLDQEIPFPGKLGLKGKIASAEAGVQSWNHEQTRRQVVYDLKKAFYDYFYLHKSLETVDESRGVLDNFAKVAESKYRVGQGIQQDVLKAQIESSKLIERRQVLEQRLTIARALINSLVHRPPESPLGKPATFEKATVRHSLEELQQLARSNAPTLKAQEGEIERSERTVDLAKKNFYPDFSVAFTYVDRDANPSMYGLQMSAKLPLYSWRKQRPELESARKGLASAKLQHESASTTLSYAVRDAYTVATTSERLVDLYKSTVIPQASVSLESAFASYQVGTVDFLTLLDSVLTLLEYQLKYYESLAELQKALAQLEPLVGFELTR